MQRFLKGLSALMVACCGLGCCCLLPASLNSDFAGLAHLGTLFLFSLPLMFLMLLVVSIGWAVSSRETPYPAAWCFAATATFIITSFFATVCYNL